MGAHAQTYLIYVAISVGLTIWVAHTLFKNGRVFLVDVFRGNVALADSVNHLLVVGFYLVNLGFVCMNLRLDTPVLDPVHAIESLAKKVGFVLFVLGGMHFLNMYVFHRVRRGALLADAPPPVAPDAAGSPLPLPRA
jgi:hypothetical protein